MLKTLLKIAFFLPFFTTTCLAQTGQISFEHLTQFNGLKEGAVNSIIQDKSGYIWLNNALEVVRYDGYQPRSYNLEKKSEGIIQIASLINDGSDNIWAQKYNGNIYKYNRQTDKFETIYTAPSAGSRGEVYYTNLTADHHKRLWFFRLTFPEKGKATRDVFFYDIVNRHVSQLPFNKEADFINRVDPSFLFQSADRQLWISSENGIWHYDEHMQKRICYLSEADSLQQKVITGIYEAPSQKGTLWLVIRYLHNKEKKDHELWIFDEKTKKASFCVKLPGTRKVLENFGNENTVYEDARKNLWISGGTNLFNYDRVKKSIVKYSLPKSFKSYDNQYIADITADDNGLLWLPSFGLISFDPATGTFSQYLANRSNPDALGHNHVTCLMKDRSGVLWVGMDQYGVDHINLLKSAFRIYVNNPNDSTSYPELAFNIQPFRNGYILSTQAGLFTWNPQDEKFHKFPLPFKQVNNINNNDYPISFIDQPGGKCYYFTAGGLNVYYPDKRHKLLRLPKSADFGLLFREPSGQLWLTGLSGTVYTIDTNADTLTRYHYAGIDTAQFTNNFSNTGWVFSDKKGRVWVFGRNYGLCLADKNTRTLIPVMSRKDQKVIVGVSTFFLASDGNIWLGTFNSGLYRFDPERRQLTHLSLPISGVGSIAEDAEHRLWMCNTNTLLKYDPQTGTSQSFSVENGIPFDAPSKLLSTPDGKMILCMANSMFVFNPAEIKPNKFPPQMVIEQVSYSDPNSPVNSGKIVFANANTHLELPHNENRLTFNYAALHFANPALNKYQYQLSGYSSRWINAGTDRSVTFNNLSPGSYTFRVRACNSDGIWTSKPAELLVVIRLPWWRTWWAWLLYLAAAALIVYALAGYRSRRLKRENRMLEEKVTLRTQQLSEQQKEITDQRDQLAKTIDRLQTTQTQLIQSEKMASLGELTAGIAHEIQNPLNFVNNFSDVSIELIEEMQTELNNGDKEEAVAISEDIKQNLEKIRHHGKRADGIVKGMLQHSRSSSGTKEPTDLNALADEYLRLAYHGLRAKDKSFNAELVINLDDKLPLVNVVPQDVGRVLLNLFTNAFYAVQQKAKTAEPDYKPTVTVTTHAAGGKAVEIIVKDNGTGIPDTIKTKIMQPFFTTKPTGEGTGLGLSLSYDIIAKGHGGSISVDSVPGQGSTFQVTLPL